MRGLKDTGKIMEGVLRCQEMRGLKETWRDHGRCIVMSRNVGSQGDMERSWKVYCDVKKCGVSRTQERSWKVYCDVKKCGVSRRHGEIMEGVL